MQKRLRPGWIVLLSSVCIYASWLTLFLAVLMQPRPDSMWLHITPPEGGGMKHRWWLPSWKKTVEQQTRIAMTPTRKTVSSNVISQNDDSSYSPDRYFPLFADDIDSKTVMVADRRTSKINQTMRYTWSKFQRLSRKAVLRLVTLPATLDNQHPRHLLQLVWLKLFLLF